MKQWVYLDMTNNYEMVVRFAASYLIVVNYRNG